MEKEPKTPLDEALAKLQKQTSYAESVSNSLMALDADRTRQINSDYQKLILPLENKIFLERTPSEFLNVTADFKSKVEHGYKIRFSEIGIFKWGGLSTRPFDLDGALGGSIFGNRHVYPDEAIKNRSSVLEMLRLGKLDLNTTSYEVVYYYKQSNVINAKTIYFGYHSNPDKTITWNLANQVTGKYANNTDLENLTNTLAEVLSKNQLETLTSKVDYPFSGEDRSGRT